MFVHGGIATRYTLGGGSSSATGARGGIEGNEIFCLTRDVTVNRQTS